VASDLVIELKRLREKNLKNLRERQKLGASETYHLGYLDAVEDCIEATRRDEQKQGFF
jgi:hypothetical protein